MPMYTVKEVAKMMKVSPQTVYDHYVKWGAKAIPGTGTVRFVATNEETLIRNIMSGKKCDYIKKRITEAEVRAKFTKPKKKPKKKPPTPQFNKQNQTRHLGSIK